MPTLKEKLFKIYEHGLGEALPNHNSREYDMMIRYGALGEVTDDYYLFIYRDLYRSPAYYGAVLFLNKRDINGRTVTISCFEETGDERERQRYIYAAIYFLKNNYSNLLKINDKIEFVLDMARKKINKFQSVKKPSVVQTLDKFKHNISNQRIKVTELQDINLGENLDNNAEAEIGKILKGIVGEDNNEEVVQNNNLSRGMLLSTSLAGGLLGQRELNFTPILISNKKKIKLQQSNLKDFTQCLDLYSKNKVLINYINLFTILKDSGIGDNKSISILNNLYFDKLADTVFKNEYMNNVFKFDEKSGEFLSLKFDLFYKIEIKFASSLNNKNSLSVFLDFITLDGKTISGKDNYFIKIIKDSVYLYVQDGQGEYYFLKPDKSNNFIKVLKFISQKSKFKVNALGVYVDSLNELRTDYVKVNTEPIKKYNLKFLPTPVLKIVKKDKKTNSGDKIVVTFDYLESIKSFLIKNPDKEHYSYDVNRDFEKECFAVLDSDSMLIKELAYDNFNRAMTSNYLFNTGSSLDWIIAQGEKYLKKGFKLYSDEQKQYIGNINGKFSINTRSGINWLEFSPEITDSISGKTLKIVEIIDEKKGLISDKKGNLHLITSAEIKKLQNIFGYGEKSGDYYKIPSSNFILINKLYDERMKDIPEIKQILINNNRIKEFDKIREYPITKNFKGVLRDYQKSGFDWLNFLREYGFNGCLADDMGLGKTVQTIAFLQSVKDNKELKSSVLIVPVSAITNWESEIKKFSKNINYLRYIGVKRKKTSINWKDYDLIITSYATLRNDIDLFKEFSFDYIVLDESQNIKNHTAQVSKAVKLLTGNHRIALSGTPVENNSIELWSLFDFLMPGYLGSLNWFKHKFERQNGTNYQDSVNERLELLKKMIFPFMLRRKKEDVEKELPPKTEIVVKLKMNEDQEQIYQETAKKYRDELGFEDKSSQLKLKNQSMKVLEGILRLRQMCLFPKLVDEKYNDISSAKFDYFKEQIKEIIAEGHKVLVFSQYTKVLALLREKIESEGIRYSYLDGSTALKKREEAIKKFQDTGENSVFLLSLKAGGVAINLTKADYVILFDLWWNPAVEAQAIDRAHRIGQTKNVIVYKMVIENSIEEKILKLQQKKKDLFENIITTDTGTIKSLSQKELLELFK